MNYSVVSSLTMFLSALLSFLLVLIGVSMMTVVESFVLPATTITTTTTSTTPTNSIFLHVDTTTTHTCSNTRHPRGKNLSPFYAASTTTIDSGNQHADADADADANSLLLQQIEDAKQILYRAADTKQEDADVVVDALVTLEKLSRKANKADPTRSEQTLAALAGVSSSAAASSAAAAASQSNSNSNNSGGVSWRLIFTTGTIDTQRKLGGTKINYFPFKATQSFDNTQSPWLIQNGIYAPFADDFALLKFEGDFDWTVTAPTGLTKVTFDFSRIQLLNGLLDIPLKKGEAASLGAKSGLGSDNNIKLTKKGKRPFFNWISADARIATARGGGGGIALWKRI